MHLTLACYHGHHYIEYGEFTNNLCSQKLDLSSFRKYSREDKLMEQESKCCKILGGVGWVGAKSPIKWKSESLGSLSIPSPESSWECIYTTAFVRVPEPRENNMS